METRFENNRRKTSEGVFQNVEILQDQSKPLIYRNKAGRPMQESKPKLCLKGH
jgi:hypothetical protein